MNRSHPSHTRGFSLIEVLIAVMILSLGLLGLAAVFPVIIRQQRLSADATQGLIVARSAQAYVQSHPVINRPSIANPATIPDVSGIPVPQSRRGWDLWRYEGINNTNSAITPGDRPNAATYRDIDVGLFRLPQLWDVRSDLNGAGNGLNADGKSDTRGNNFIFGSGLLTNPPRRFEEPMIPLRDRLWPAAYSAVDDHWQESKYGNEPRFVWDLALLRDEAGTPRIFTDDRARVAVFVRRIDSGVRLPVRNVEDDFYDPLAISQRISDQRPGPQEQFRGVRISDVLLGNQGAVNEFNRTRLIGTDDYRVPVAMTAGATSPDSSATMDGLGDYAALRTEFVEGFQDPDSATGTNYTRMIFPAGIPDGRFTILSQPNQRFADNLGNVYTVLKPDANAPPGVRAVVITPAAPKSAREMAALDAQGLQIVYSPIPPAAIVTFTVEPR